MLEGTYERCLYVCAPLIKFSDQAKPPGGTDMFYSPWNGLGRQITLFKQIPCANLQYFLS
jgi:hypothetical protein